MTPRFGHPIQDPAIFSIHNNQAMKPLSRVEGLLQAPLFFAQSIKRFRLLGEGTLLDPFSPVAKDNLRHRFLGGRGGKTNQGHEHGGQETWERAVHGNHGGGRNPQVDPNYSLPFPYPFQPFVYFVLFVVIFPLPFPT